jgi:hypothetical protein
MNYQEFDKAKQTFNIQSISNYVKENEQLRDEFVRYFTPQKIASMTIDEYVIGLQNKESFCYKLERTLKNLGNISGQPSFKFGVWFSPSKMQYCFEQRFGNNHFDAFQKFKLSLLQLLEDGKHKNYDAIKNNPINSLIKGKILATYYPEKYLNIYSIKHLNFYLTALDLNSKDLMAADAVDKREALVNFKNSDKDMSKWSNYVFSIFLWSHYPKSPRHHI